MSVLTLTWSHPDLMEDPLGGILVTSGIYEESLSGDLSTAYFRVRIPNPGSLSLLNASTRTATLTEGSGGDARTIAVGRMVAVPTDLGGDEVELEFICIPADEEAELKSAADLVRVGEIDLDDAEPEAIEAGEVYDPLFYPRDDDDPFSVLAATLDYWRWHPTTHALSRISMVTPASTKTLPADDGFGDPRIIMPEPPLALAKYRAIATWTQQSTGRQTWEVENGAWDIMTYSAEDLVAALPSSGTRIGENTGWYISDSVIDSVTVSGVADRYDVAASTHALDDPNVSRVSIYMQPRTVRIGMRLGWEYSQQREDILTIQMPAAVQDVMGTDKEEIIDIIDLAALNLDHETPEWQYEDAETLEVMSYAVGDKVQANGKCWTCVKAHEATTNFRVWRWTGGAFDDYEQLWSRIPKKSAMSNLASNRFWDTPRGQRARHHALRRVRRELTRRAYCLEVEFDCTWAFAATVTTADSVTVPKLLEGSATGRVVSVQLIHENNGSRMGRIRMRVPVGDSASDPGGHEHSTDGIEYDLAAPAPRAPVNVSALAGQSPTVFLSNDYGAQKSAALMSGDPFETIQSMPTRVTIQVDALREEDLLVRRCTITAAPLAIPEGVKL
jgi:hypothetical protein